MLSLMSKNKAIRVVIYKSLGATLVLQLADGQAGQHCIGSGEKHLVWLVSTLFINSVSYIEGQKAVLATHNSLYINHNVLDVGKACKCLCKKLLGPSVHCWSLGASP